MILPPRRQRSPEHRAGGGTTARESRRHGGPGGDHGPPRARAAAAPGRRRVAPTGAPAPARCTSPTRHHPLARPTSSPWRLPRSLSAASTCPTCSRRARFVSAGSPTRPWPAPDSTTPTSCRSSTWGASRGATSSPWNWWKARPYGNIYRKKGLFRRIPMRLRSPRHQPVRLPVPVQLLQHHFVPADAPAHYP